MAPAAALPEVPDVLAGFTRRTFAPPDPPDGSDEAPGATTRRDVYILGEGPAVIVMAEMPGITPRVAGFARRVADAGMTAWVPQLFGRIGEPPGAAAYARSLVPACVARDFAAFAGGGTAPIVGWLRALAAEAHATSGGRGVGAVGMCFTGGFALGMAVDERMVAPVLSQPSLPLVVPWRRGNAASVQLSDEDRMRVAERAAAGLCVLGLRFTGDRLVPQERFTALAELLGDAFTAVEIDSSPDNPDGLGRRAHSVLTEELVDQPGHPTHDALERVLGFLADRLGVR